MPLQWQFAVSTAGPPGKSQECGTFEEAHLVELKLSWKEETVRATLEMALQGDDVAAET